MEKSLFKPEELTSSEKAVKSHPLQNQKARSEYDFVSKGNKIALVVNVTII